MEVKPGLYRHFKGHDVRVFFVAKHSETLEDYVVYEHIGENPRSKYWIRPAEMFMEEVDRDGKRQPRFTYIGESDLMEVYAAIHGLIERDGKYLFLKRTINGKTVWDLPGGRVKHGENPYQTLQREVKDEIQAEIEIERPLGMWWFYRILDGREVVSTLYLCRLASGEARLTQDAREVEYYEGEAWLTREEMLSESYPHSDTSLNDLLNNL